jgi:hypothetical protein
MGWGVWLCDGLYYGPMKMYMEMPYKIYSMLSTLVFVHTSTMTYPNAYAMLHAESSQTRPSVLLNSHDRMVFWA